MKDKVEHVREWNKYKKKKSYGQTDFRIIRKYFIFKKMKINFFLNFQKEKKIIYFSREKINSKIKIQRYLLKLLQYLLKSLIK